MSDTYKGRGFIQLVGAWAHTMLRAVIADMKATPTVTPATRENNLHQSRRSRRAKFKAKRRNKGVK